MTEAATEEFKRLAEGALAEFATSTPEQKDAFRRSFLFALTAGILCTMNTESPLVTPTHAELRERIRERMREQQAEHAGQTALAALRAGQEIMVEEYAITSQVDPGVKVESELAYVTRNWGLSEPMVDEAFAAEVLDYIELES